MLTMRSYFEINTLLLLLLLLLLLYYYNCCCCCFTEVEYIVNGTLFLLSDRASMINGATVPVDGGITTHI